MKRLLISFLFFVLCSLFLIWQTVLRNQSILSFDERRAAFQERWATVFGLGRPFPDLRLSHKGQDLQTVDVARGNWSLYLFSPQCNEAVLTYPTCLVKPNLERFRELIEQGIDFQKERILLIFSKAHLLEEIQVFAADDPSWPEIYRGLKTT